MEQAVIEDGSATFVEMVIGRPYEPAGLHCWRLVQEMQQVVFKRILPPVLVAPERMQELIGMMDLRHVYDGWKEVQQPEHGAVVFMTKNGHDVSKAACHAGVWLDLDGGGILHTDYGHGVVFETMAMIKLHNWGSFSYHVPTS